MAEVMIFSPLDRLLWGMAMVILFIAGTFYFIKGKKSENFKEKVMMYGFSFFFLFLMFYRLFLYISEFYVQGYYFNHAFYGDYNNTTPTWEIYIRLSSLCGNIGIALFILSYEITFKRTKYLLSSGMIILIIFEIFLPYELSEIIAVIIGMAGIFSIILIIYKFAKISHPEFSGVSMVLLIGIITLFLGHCLELYLVKELNIFPLILAPIIFISGTLIFLSPIVINPKHFSQSFVY